MVHKAISLVLLLTFVAAVSADSCGLEIVDLLPSGIKLLDDINSGNQAQLKADIQSTLPLLGQAAKVCTGFTPKSTCDSEIQALLPSYLVVAQDVTVQDIPKLQKDIAAVVPQTNQAVLDCTGLTITSQCSSDLLNLIEPASLVVKDIKSGDFTNLEKDISNLLPSARVALSLCTSHPISDQCQNDIDGLVPVINNVVNDLANGSIGNLVNDLTQIISSLKALSSDCLGKALGLRCEADLGGLIPVALQAYNDIEAKNYDQLQKDLQAAGPQIQRALDNCLGGSEEEEEVSADPCGDALAVLIPYVESIYNDATANNYNGVFTQVGDANKPINSAIDVCLSWNSSTETLTKKPEVSPCIEAFRDLMSAVEDMKEELESKEFRESFETLIDAIPEVQTLIDNCLPL